MYNISVFILSKNVNATVTFSILNALKMRFLFVKAITLFLSFKKKDNPRSLFLNKGNFAKKISFNSKICKIPITLKQHFFEKR